MGHIRLGRLPKTKQWHEVFSALENDNLSAEILARAISKAARNEFEALKGDNSLSFCFWFLSYIISSANSKTFEDRLEKIGVETKKINSGLEFVKKLSNYISSELNEIGRPNAFSNIAELSLNETITKLLINQTSTLFGTSIEDIKSACSKSATKKQFGIISRQFFSTFLTRSLDLVADKEISNYVGKNKTFKNPSELLSFKDALSTYCYQTSRIVEEFSGGWFTKQAWQTKNDITYESAKGFMAYAIEKVNMDLIGGTS